MQHNTQKLTGKPRWWTDSHNSAWENVRDAVKREWEAAERHSEVDQNVDTATERTLGDARFDSGEPRNVEVDRAAAIPDDDFEPASFEHIEPAFRYGAGARQQYPEYTVWTEDLEARLRRDWGEANDESAWARIKAYVRRGWESARRAMA